MAIPKKGTAPAGRKSMKMEADELTEKIKACVKEALDEQAEAKAEGEEGTEDAVAEVAPADISGLIEDAMAVVAEKRKSRKEAGEELGDVTAEEVMEAVGEIIDATEGEAKEDDGVEEEVKEDEEVTDEAKGRKAATRKHQTKSARKSAASPVQRKYSSIYMSRTTPTSTAKKSIPPAVQLARAIKCLDVFGKHDPDAASFYAQRKYDDADMAREFKALSATNPAAGGYLIPEIYLDQIIELLYSKTVIFELGAGEEDHRKLYFGRTQNKSLAVTNRRSIVIYGDQDEEYPDAAYVGNVGPFYPESVTWKFKRPQGLTVPDLTNAERDALEEANVNFLTVEYKREYVKNGVCADGEFIDVQMGADYIAKNMRENLYDIFLENPTIGYTDAGFALVAAGVFSALNRATDLGIIALDPESEQGVFTVVVPKRSQATDEEARARQMPDITWEAQLEGAVHTVKVKGVLRATLSA